MRLLRRLAGLLLLTTPVAWAQPVTPLPQTQFSAAHEALGERRFQDAIRDFGAFRQAYPDHPGAADALFYLAQSTLALGHDDRAVQLFEQFERSYPTHPLAYEARLAAGRVFFERGEYARTISTLTDLIASRPPAEAGAKAYFWMGEAALQLGEDDRALAFFKRATDLYPSTTTAPTALYAVAYHQVRLDRQSDAARTFEQLEARYPDSPYSRDLGLAFAEVYYELEDYARLVQETERRLEALAPPARERALFLLAEAYNHLRRSDEADRTYRTLLTDYASGPYYRLALLGRARNAYADAGYDRADEYYRLAADGQRDSLAAEAVYREAAALKLKGDIDAAADRFEYVYDTWPRHRAAEQALFERGVLEYERERWESASLAFERLLRAFRDSPFTDEALELFANARIGAGDAAGAERLFSQALARRADAAPDVRDAIAFQQAYLLYGSGAYEQAARTFEKLAQEGATPAIKGDALFWLGETQFQQGNLNDALASLRSYEARYPEGLFRNAARYVTGWAYFRQERYQPASLAFEAFLDHYERDPEMPSAPAYEDDAHLRLGDSYYALGRHLEAVNAYARVRGDDRDYAYYQIGQSYFFAGQPDRGRRSLERILREYPQSALREEAAYSIGYFFLQENRYDDAVQAFQRVVTDYPRDPIAGKALYGVGDAYYNRGMLEDAAQAYQAVLTRYGNTPFAADAATSLRAALMGLGRDEEANAVVESFAATAAPDVAEELRFRQAEDLYVRGRYREAEPALAAFIRATRNRDLQTDALYYLGDLYANEGRTDDAARALNQVLSAPANRRQADAARRLGQLMIEAGRPRDALEAYRTLERLAGDTRAVVVEARVGQGLALLADRRYDQAESLFAALIEAADDPATVATARLGQARVKEAQGDLAGALDAYGAIHDRDGGEAGAEALYRLGALLLRMDNPDAALAALQPIETRYSGYDTWVGQGLLVQARAHARLGNAAEALRLYNQVAEDYPETSWAQTAQEERQRL